MKSSSLVDGYASDDPMRIFTTISLYFVDSPMESRLLIGLVRFELKRLLLS